VHICFKTSEPDYYPLLISPGSYASTQGGVLHGDIPITAILKGKNKGGGGKKNPKKKN